MVYLVSNLLYPVRYKSSVINLTCVILGEGEHLTRCHEQYGGLAIGMSTLKTRYDFLILLMFKADNLMRN